MNEHGCVRSNIRVNFPSSDQTGDHPNMTSDKQNRGRAMPKPPRNMVPVPVQRPAPYEPLVFTPPPLSARPPEGMTWGSLSKLRQTWPARVPYSCPDCKADVTAYDWGEDAYTCYSGHTTPRGAPDPEHNYPLTHYDDSEFFWWRRYPVRRPPTPATVMACPFCGIERPRSIKGGGRICTVRRQVEPGVFADIGCGMIWRQAHD